MMNDAQRQAIRDVIHTCFPGLVQSIQIEDGLDRDDDPVARIIIAFKPGVFPDQEAMLDLSRIVKPVIESTRTFPIIDFLSAADATKRKSVAA